MMFLRNSQKWIAMVVVVAHVALALFSDNDGALLFNFSATMEWTPGEIKDCASIAEVETAVAQASGRVKPFGSLWSWSTQIAQDGDTYIRLTGPMADASLIEVVLTEENSPSVIVNGGVKAFDLYMELQQTAYNIESKGSCLTAAASQTVGGLMATNVHHSGTKSFYEIAEWIEVVTANDGLVRTFRDEPLYRVTVGGAGRTGVIVRVQLQLVPRATYLDVENVPQPSDESFQTFFSEFVGLTEGYEDNELIGVGLRKPGYLTSIGPDSIYLKRRTPTPLPNPAVLNANYGKLSIFGRFVTVLDNITDWFMPPFLHTLLGSIFFIYFFDGAQPDRRGTMGEDLDVASSFSNLPNVKHLELELFVPTSLASALGAFLDHKFAAGEYNYIFRHSLVALRYVPGVNSLTAANGVLADGTTPDAFLAVNFDAFQRSRYSRFRAELSAMLADVSAAFPLQIRTHPGKYNPPLSPDPESDTVKELIASFDPNGVFARDVYDPSYHT